MREGARQRCRRSERNWVEGCAAGGERVVSTPLQTCRARSQRVHPSEKKPLRGRSRALAWLVPGQGKGGRRGVFGTMLYIFLFSPFLSLLLLCAPFLSRKEDLLTAPRPYSSSHNHIPGAGPASRCLRRRARSRGRGRGVQLYIFIMFYISVFSLPPFNPSIPHLRFHLLHFIFILGREEI